MAIQMHHADENFEKCLEVLEESQRIVKTHYGTQSSEVSRLLQRCGKAGDSTESPGI